jgi:hypothetical protein
MLIALAAPLDATRTREQYLYPAIPIRNSKGVS